jgi:DNA-binding LytR/AlgR family response regulator
MQPEINRNIMSTEKINVLIVEDEAITALDLSEGLRQCGYAIAGVADNARAAKTLYEEKKADIVLMDIQLKGEKDGVDTVVELMKTRKSPVIYLTAFTDAATVERVKNTYPAAFLTKPYNVDNVRIAIELALHNFAAGKAPDQPARQADREPLLRLNDNLFVKMNYRFVKLPLSSICYVAADNNHAHLVASDKKYVVRLSLNQVLESIGWDRLIRIHRSYAVNIDAVSSFTEQEVTVNKDILPVGRQYKEAFWRQFGTQ